jgi:hypothetical protein
MSEGSGDKAGVGGNGTGTGTGTGNGLSLTLTAKDIEVNERLARRKAAGHVIDLKKVPGIDLIADQALIGYLKIIVEVTACWRSFELSECGVK